MSVIAERFWHEPAVAIGALITVILAAVSVARAENFDAVTVGQVLGPLIAALGIRPFVTPAGSANAPPAPPSE